ncbi:MAG: sulfotransferase family 2 domain-containing protein [Verrucomicrobiales bacterium]|nr:sulfotransferase family 2 domain-containing protein [Verrucomicrobiales bacterium]
MAPDFREDDPIIDRLRESEAWSFRIKEMFRLFNHRKRLKIYHIHVQKTGGSTVNHQFAYLAFERNIISKYETGELKVSGLDFSSPNWRESTEARKVVLLANRLPGRVFEGNKFRFVSGPGVRDSVPSGNFDFAFSHIPFYELKLPPNAFSFSVFRNPVERLCSRYRMLVELNRTGLLNHYGGNKNRGVLESGFEAWVSTTSRDELNHHLHMFSRHGEVEEAIDLASKVDEILWTETLDSELPALFDKLDIREKYRDLERIKVGKSDQWVPSALELSIADEVTRPDRLFLEAMKRTSGLP